MARERELDRFNDRELKLKNVRNSINLTENLTMVERSFNPMNQDRPSKKRMLPTEIAHRFNCKDDFLSYFANQLQLYVPPKVMVNKGK